MSMTILRADGASFNFDTIQGGTITPSANVFKHTIADGSKATDHVQRKLTKIAITVDASATPLGAFFVEGGEARVRRAKEFLSECFGQYLTLVIPTEGTYRTVLLETTPWELQAMASRRFSLTFTVGRRVFSESAIIPERTGGTGGANETLPADTFVGPPVPEDLDQDENQSEREKVEDTLEGPVDAVLDVIGFSGDDE